ncbi:TPA: hypothetical protein P2N00_000515 [Aeromonas salmonicida]|uniref:Uncharacterized protein n=1 Tax=Aeromonas salmonicida subsp. salmonicida TaxID=29491 RepID=A0A0A7KTQ7_AERSS|nr:hypothetical protein [Aeromonas salmonicida]AIZ49618.1 hypothetical protein [Aeromonas salmonicida subsp. salmonicida]OAH88282.1 hypothetical protein AXW79_01485 [Aeromonas salmonicida subsp. salmonicida]OKA78066.1 hypothetical protein BHR41_02530 [Aeromonas salmonicida subsp. salmonicida]SPT73608.1 Uncharacterised protein [Aeromonas salmonicida]HDN9784877.1 hypothetical protein [Aeromonas salmonicida]
MKRYDCTMHDKRGAFGLCMEARSEGQFVPFTKVEQLQAKIFGLLEERNSTGIAIDKAILSGIVPEQHPLRSRLERLANHHKREQALADGMVALADRCTLLADLLREVTQIIPAIGVAIEDLPVADAFLERIEKALAGQVLEHVGNDTLAMMMDELHDICVGLDAPGGEQNGAEAWDQVKGARDRVLASLHHGRTDAEWTDATTSPVAADYRELQEQHDQLQSRLKVALGTLQLALPYVEHAIEFAPSQQISDGHKIFAAHITAALTGDRGELIAMMQEQNPADALVLMSYIASLQRYTLGGHCDSFGQDCGAEMEQDDEGEYVLLAEALALPAAPIPSGDELCATEPRSSSPD